jgi:transcriptional antiterminator RfaH
MQHPEGVAVGRFEGRWFVAHTKPRQEKALARDLLRLRDRYFLPMYEATRRSRRRRWKALLPLFAGYVFVCGSEDDRLVALKTHRIVRLIEVEDQAPLVAELSAIERLLAAGQSVDPRSSLAAGRRCRIRTGPLAGLEGRVERRKDRTRFVVNVTILGQGATVEIDADSVEPMD